KMTPEAFRMIGVEAHRLLYPTNPLLCLALPGKDLALLDDDKIVVGVELQRPILMIRSLLMVAADQIDGGENAVHIAVVLVETEGDFQLGYDLPPGGFAVSQPT